MNNEKIFKIGFMGSAGRGKELPQALLKLARATGRAITTQGCILVTGGCMGLPYEATLGALATFKSALATSGGEVIWFSPAKDLREHANPPLNYPIPLADVFVKYTGRGKNGRISDMIAACDGVIICSGHLGSAIEFLMAYQENKVIGILLGSGGIADQAEQLLTLVNKKTNAVVISDSNPATLVAKVIRAIAAKKL